MHDIGLSVGQLGISSRDDLPSNDGTVKCHHCCKRLVIRNMRAHVGIHIISGTLAYPHKATTCGYCGKQSCKSSLVFTSRKNNKNYYRVESDCSYKFVAGRVKSTLTTRNKCTNCQLCYEVSSMSSRLLEVQLRDPLYRRTSWRGTSRRYCGQ